MMELSFHSTPIKFATRPLRGAIFAVLSIFGSRAIPDIEIPSSLELAEGSIEGEGVVRDAYGSIRAGNPNRTWRVLTDWLKSRGDQAEDYAWLAWRLGAWGDPRHTTRLVEERVARLLALKRMDEALQVLAQRLTVDTRFRPRSSADTLSLAQLAARRGDLPRVAQVLLSDFASRFSGDPRVTVAESLRRHLNSRAPLLKQSA